MERYLIPVPDVDMVCGLGYVFFERQETQFFAIVQSYWLLVIG